VRTDLPAAQAPPDRRLGRIEHDRDPEEVPRRRFLASDALRPASAKSGNVEGDRRRCRGKGK
jgi:hypothetical protein